MREVDAKSLTVCSAQQAMTQAEWSALRRSKRIPISELVACGGGEAVELETHAKTLHSYLKALERILAELAEVGCFPSTDKPTAPATPHVRYTSSPQFVLQRKAKSKAAVAMKLTIETIADSARFKCRNFKLASEPWGRLLGVVESTTPGVIEKGTAPASASTSAEQVPMVVPPPASAQRSDTSSSSEDEHVPSSDEEEEKEFLWFRCGYTKGGRHAEVRPRCDVFGMPGFLYRWCI
jgi:hypothetical protein